MIITRFPPSPTGFLHVGGLRTALYNYLYAKQHNGRFILRIEDTDQKRFVKGAVENLIRTLHWAGLEWDEGPDVGGAHGPYVQSERLEIYKQHAAELVNKGHAYYCFCTPERLEKVRMEARLQSRNSKLPPMYDRHCLNLSVDEINQKIKNHDAHVIRQKIPDQSNVAFDDLIRGEVSFQCETIDDQILLKSDGFPTYHLANVVDDHLMEVTHVIRGEEWLSSTPKHVLLYENFGWEKPIFAHLPLLLNKDRSKLSKRQNDVAVEDYMQKGYLKEAILNFIALLGWHPGETEQELFSMDELLELFSLDKVHKSGAIFELEKLDWMNWQWRRKMFEQDPRDKTAKLLELARQYLKPEWERDRPLLDRALVTIEEKILKNPSETPLHIGFYFKEKIEAPLTLIENAKMKVDKATAQKALTEVLTALTAWNDFSSPEKVQICLTAVVNALGLKNGQVLWPTRVALTGEQFSPGVFEVIWALNKDKTLQRIKNTLTQIQ